MLSSIVIALFILASPMASSQPLLPNVGARELRGTLKGGRQQVWGPVGSADTQVLTHRELPSAHGATHRTIGQAASSHQQGSAAPGKADVPLVRQAYSAQAPALKLAEQPAAGDKGPLLGTRPTAFPAATAPVLVRQLGALPGSHARAGSFGNGLASSAGSGKEEEEGFGHWQPSSGAPSVSGLRGGSFAGGSASAGINGRQGPAAAQPLFSSGGSSSSSSSSSAAVLEMRSSALLGRRGGGRSQGPLFLGGGRAAEGGGGEGGCGLFANCDKRQQAGLTSQPHPAGAEAQQKPEAGTASGGAVGEESELVTVTVVVQQRPEEPRDLLRLFLKGAAGVLQPGRQQ